MLVFYATTFFALLTTMLSYCSSSLGAAPLLGASAAPPRACGAAPAPPQLREGAGSALLGARFAAAAATLVCLICGVARSSPRTGSPPLVRGPRAGGGGAPPLLHRLCAAAALLLGAARAACPSAAAPGSYCAGAVETVCPIGTFCAGGAAVSVPCPAGAYSPAGAPSCAFTASTCPVGTYAAAPASCVACSPAAACTVVGLTAQPLLHWNVSTLAGSGAAGFASGQGAAAAFHSPSGLSLDFFGTLYVADSGNNRIRAVTPAGVVSVLAGSGAAAWADGSGTAASFNFPRGVATNRNSGSVHIADTNSNRIRSVTPAGVVTTLAGSGVAQFADGAGTAASFSFPSGVAIDASGTLFVADTFNNRLRTVTPGGVVATLAGQGAAGFLDGTASTAKFFRPSSVALHSSGKVFIADSANNRIRVMTPAYHGLPWTVATLAGSGAASFADGIGLGASFNAPSGVAVDALGNVFVADTNSSRIRKVSPAGSVTTLAGSGAGAFADGAGTDASFRSPSGIAIDPSGNLFVADQLNNRIRSISQPPMQLTAASPSGDLFPGYYFAKAGRIVTLSIGGGGGGGGGGKPGGRGASFAFSFISTGAPFTISAIATGGTSSSSGAGGGGGATAVYSGNALLAAAGGGGGGSFCTGGGDAGPPLGSGTSNNCASNPWGSGGGSNGEDGSGGAAGGQNGPTNAGWCDYGWSWACPHGLGSRFVSSSIGGNGEVSFPGGNGWSATQLGGEGWASGGPGYSNSNGIDGGATGGGGGEAAGRKHVEVLRCVPH